MLLKGSKNTVLYGIVILFVLSMAELIVFSHEMLYASRFLTWVYFLSGVIIAMLPLFRYEKFSCTVSEAYSELVKKAFAYVGYVFFFILLYRFVYITDSYRLNFRYADMLPSIEILAKRFLSGQRVYEPLTEINRPAVLYGPGFWLPYAIPVLLKIDLRWTSFFFFMLGTDFVWYQVGKQKINIVTQILLYIMIGLGCYFYFYDIWTDMRLTQEPLIIGYYLLLGFVLLQNGHKYQWLWAGLMIGLCLLSRFSFLLWIPVYFVYLWKYEGIKKAIQLGSIIGLLVLLLFLVPFGIDGIKKFATLPSFQANQMAERFADFPRDKVLGMAKFFSSKDGWFIYNLQRGFSALIMVLGIVTVLISPKWIDRTWLPLSFLKLALVFFCNFLQIPYPYLFGPSTFLSIIIVIGFVQQKVEWSFSTHLSTLKIKTSVIQHKAVIMLCILLPVVIYAMVQVHYLKKKYFPYEKNTIAIYEQNLNTLSEEAYWIKTVLIDSTQAHTGKYSNAVGMKNPYSCTFKVPFQYLKEKKYKGVRFSAWVKSNEIQIDISRMIITVSNEEKVIFYRDKDISPQLVKDNIWRKHVFAVEIPEDIISKTKPEQNHVVSAFISYFDPNGYIYVDDMSVEFF